MKKLLRKSAIILTLAATALAGCSSSEPSSSANSGSGGSAEPIKLSVAHVFPEGHPGGVHLNKFAEQVKERTNGAVEVEVHHNAVLGSEHDELQQIQAGNLDMALIYGISLWQNMNPKLGIEELPFVFKSPEHAHKALDGEFGKAVSDLIQEQGFTVLSYWENGFRHFTNSKNAIVEPADMNGIKFRSAEVPIRLEMFKLLQASAIPMGFNEVFTALQQGTVDGQENPLSLIDSAKFYEVQKYLSLSGHIYNSAVLVIGPQALEKLNDEQKKVVKDLAEELKVEERNMIAKQDQELIEKLKGEGMEINEINRDAFVEAVKPLWESYTKEHGDDLLKLIQKAEQ